MSSIKTVQLPQNRDDWQPTFSSWRHGGWYVDNLQYPSGAVGCVSRNYDDGKWRIVCDPRPFAERPTFPNRTAAAFGERDLIAQQATPQAEAEVGRHTPTPWHVWIDDTGDPISGGYPSISPAEELDTTIVHSAGFHHEFWDSHPTKREQVANAHLIVKAVNTYTTNQQRIAELEAALRDCVERISQSITVGDLVGDEAVYVMRVLRDVAAKGRTVLNRKEGE